MPTARWTEGTRDGVLGEARPGAMPTQRRERQREEPHDVGRNGLDVSCAMVTKLSAGSICAWDGYPRGQEEGIVGR